MFATSVTQIGSRYGNAQDSAWRRFKSTRTVRKMRDDDSSISKSKSNQSNSSSNSGTVDASAANWKSASTSSCSSATVRKAASLEHPKKH